MPHLGLGDAHSTQNPHNPAHADAPLLCRAIWSAKSAIRKERCQTWMGAHPGSETDLGESHDHSMLLALLECASAETKTPALHPTPGGGQAKRVVAHGVVPFGLGLLYLCVLLRLLLGGSMLIRLVMDFLSFFFALL